VNPVGLEDGGLAVDVMFRSFLCFASVIMARGRRRKNCWGAETHQFIPLKGGWNAWSSGMQGEDIPVNPPNLFFSLLIFFIFLFLFQPKGDSVTSRP
jgi:hypothetical protein